MMVWLTEFVREHPWAEYATALTVLAAALAIIFTCS
jgi:hypothetical protein